MHFISEKTNLVPRAISLTLETRLGENVNEY